MSPQEQAAKEIVYKHHLRDGESEKAASDYPERLKPYTPDELFAWPEYQALADDIAAALAASAAKVTELDQDKTRLQRDVDGLEATRMDLSNRCGALTAKLQASERELERVREAWDNFKASLGSDPVTGERYDCDGAFAALDSKLASPEARATGEDSA